MAALISARAALRRVPNVHQRVFVSAFHAARKNNAEPAAGLSKNENFPVFPIIPGGPVLEGSVNEPTTFPEPNRMHGSHHWAFERLLSVALVPMTVSAFAVSPTAYPILDGVLAISLVVHSHIGFDSCVVDYVHSRKFPRIGPIVKWGLRLATTGALVGIYQFNTEDIGLTELVRRAWHA
ncbi:membrane anchor subunit of succinate dehydrogenase, Sdh4 [Ceratobasidium sp. 392]|nr:membrane anchor subunit of succinate dehydrogenase, Sdh4 [Ceratobasidium sp. 392]